MPLSQEVPRTASKAAEMLRAQLLGPQDLPEEKKSLPRRLADGVTHRLLRAKESISDLIGTGLLTEKPMLAVPEHHCDCYPPCQSSKRLFPRKKEATLSKLSLRSTFRLSKVDVSNASPPVDRNSVDESICRTPTRRAQGKDSTDTASISSTVRSIFSSTLGRRTSRMSLSTRDVTELTVHRSSPIPVPVPAVEVTIPTPSLGSLEDANLTTSDQSSNIKPEFVVGSVPKHSMPGPLERPTPLGRRCNLSLDDISSTTGYFLKPESSQKLFATPGCGAETVITPMPGTNLPLEDPFQTQSLCQPYSFPQDQADAGLGKLESGREVAVFPGGLCQRPTNPFDQAFGKTSFDDADPHSQVIPLKVLPSIGATKSEGANKQDDVVGTDGTSGISQSVGQTQGCVNTTSEQDSCARDDRHIGDSDNPNNGNAGISLPRVELESQAAKSGSPVSTADSSLDRTKARAPPDAENFRIASSKITSTAKVVVAQEEQRQPDQETDPDTKALGRLTIADFIRNDSTSAKNHQAISERESALVTPERVKGKKQLAPLKTPDRNGLPSQQSPLERRYWTPLGTNWYGSPSPGSANIYSTIFVREDDSDCENQKSSEAGKIAVSPKAPPPSPVGTPSRRALNVLDSPVRQNRQNQSPRRTPTSDGWGMAKPATEKVQRALKRRVRNARSFRTCLPCERTNTSGPLLTNTTNGNCDKASDDMHTTTEGARGRSKAKAGIS